VRPTVILLAAGLALTACGEAPRPAAEPRVQLKLEVPDDGRAVRTDHVAVRGTVVPADAAVKVSGADADVQGGEFNADVELQPGGNVIDITATSPGRRPATDALRVMRDMRVEVPDLTGVSYDDAASKLEGLGLQVTEEVGGGWLDRVLPGPISVCETSPKAGTLVQPHTTVTVTTAHSC
jgi:beta-lactam-binding protein with PASTA domain